MMQLIADAEVCFVEGGKAIWVNGPEGNVLRIQCSGRINIRRECANFCPHADINVVGDIEICMPGPAVIRSGPKYEAFKR